MTCELWPQERASLCSMCQATTDSLAGDYRSFTDSYSQTPLTHVNGEEPKNPFPAVNAADGCGSAPCLISKAHLQFGYYSALPVPGLRLIALNSIILGKEYHPRDNVSQLDAGNAQLSWLEQELKDAAASEQKVYIAMHIPPGMDAYGVSHNKHEPWMWAHKPSQSDSWLNKFLTLTEAHQSVVAGILYGHTHLDEVRRLYDSQGKKITEVAVAAPGITPQHYNNPGFKTVFYDAASKELTDFVTHYTQLHAHDGSGNPIWKNETYSFSKVFGCDSGTTMLDCLGSDAVG